MVRFLDLALLLSLQTTSVFGQIDFVPDDQVQVPATSAKLDVAVSVSFPDAEEIFGIKLINGKPTDSLISFSNQETEPVTVQFVGGSLWTPDFDPSGSRVIRNLTTKQYSVEIPPGEKQTLPYRFHTNMHPQELRLNIAAVLSQENAFFTIQAFNGTVAVAEPDASFFDPQMIFLYLVLAATVVAVFYGFYDKVLVPYLFPNKNIRGGRRQTPAKQPLATAPTSDNEGPATATGAQTYNEEWIPAHHFQRPEARRVKSSGRPKSKQGKE